MDEPTPKQPEEPKAIIKAAQYEQELSKLHKREGLPPLSGEDMARAEEQAMQLIRSEERLDDIVTFGDETQTAMAAISKEMLKGVRLGTLDEIVKLSDDVLSGLHTIDVADLVPQARPVLWILRETAGMIRRRIKEFFRRFQLVNAYLDRQAADINAKEWASTERFNQDKALAKASLHALQEARIKATAITLFLDGECGHLEADRRLEAVNREKQTAQAEGRAMDYLMVASADRYAKYVERLESKHTGLYKAQTTAYAIHRASLMMGDNESVIRQKLHDLNTEMLPQWRTMIAVAYQAYQQAGIAQFIRRLNEEEGRLWDVMGRQIDLTARQIAELMTGEVIDVNALRRYHQRLTNALDTLKTASVESKKIRGRAEEEMQKLMSEVSEAATAVTQRKE